MKIAWIMTALILTSVLLAYAQRRAPRAVYAALWAGVAVSFLVTGWFL